VSGLFVTKHDIYARLREYVWDLMVQKTNIM
jgi:hypothetical protein